jgi:PadR family transcriptional regulator, regulatory protein PadR
MMEICSQFYEIVCKRLIERVSIQGLILPTFISGFVFIGKRRSLNVIRRMCPNSKLNPPTRRGLVLLLSQMKCDILSCGKPNRDMKETDVRQGTLALMVLKTLEVLGPLHGYGIARRIEQISGDILTVNQGTLYPVLLRLEQEGSIASEWGVSENNRRARFYRLTRDGRKQLQAETRNWEQTAAIIGRFFAVKAEDLK